MALVVDDSMLVRHLVCRFLEERGFAVETAADGAEALQRLSAPVLPSLIITDLHMPQMSGSELITALKARPETAAIPIVVIAAKATARLMEEENRANAFIYKDIEMTAQLDRVVRQLASEAGEG